MQKKSVNLLQKRGAPPTFWEKAYDWLTNTARIIVIIVEVFVLGAFGWRFWLDRTLTDLKENIEDKGEVLKSLSSQEDEIRILQRKMTAHEELWVLSSNLSPIIEEVNNYIPSETEELKVSLTVEEEGRLISISGKVSREKIDRLENKLKDSTNFSDVTLSDIEKESTGEDAYVFSLSARIIFNTPREAFSQNESTESTSDGTL
jgi:hypothetical protein